MSPKQQVALICIVGQKTNSQNGKKNDRLEWPITHVESADKIAEVADFTIHTKETHVTDLSSLTDADVRPGVSPPLVCLPVTPQ